MSDWKFKNIPKIAHFYWGRGLAMSYLNYLSIFTFRKFNPDWEITLWTTSGEEINDPNWLDPKQALSESMEKSPNLYDAFSKVFTLSNKEQSTKYTGYDYFSEACDLASRVNKLPLSKIHPVQNADFVRIECMKEVGGVWSDFDILYRKPLSYLNNVIKDTSVELSFSASSISVSNDGSYQEVDLNGREKPNALFHVPNHFSIGLMLSKPQTELFKAVSKHAIEKGCDLNKYQGVGVELFHQHRHELLNQNYHNIPMDYFYPIYHTHLYKLYLREEVLPLDNIGIHWYNGNDSSGEFRNLLKNESEINNLQPSTMINAIKEIL